VHVRTTMLDVLLRWSVVEEEREVAAAREQGQESAGVRFMSPHSVEDSVLFGITITNQIRRQTSASSFSSFSCFFFLWIRYCSFNFNFYGKLHWSPLSFH
jgi:hypothetical protein